jgi:hypothetical protein
MWLFALGLGTFFVVKSTHMVMHLRLDPPPEFVDTRPEWKPERRRVEESVARAYWDSAIKFVEPKYAFGSSLPVEPIADFKADPRALPDSVGGSAQDRDRYWRNLHRVWTLPQTWQKKYEFDTNWIFEGQ